MMAPIPSESVTPRPRRRKCARKYQTNNIQLNITFTEAFIATCSPDELLGQVIQALCPKYHIDAPHLFALRNVISSAIVAPRKPPQLKRTRPDRRIGQLGSIYDTPPCSPYGVNGPPGSVNQSFYFHHQDPDFKRLLPGADCSRYERLDESANQEVSDGQEIPNSQENMQSEGSITSASTAERNASPKDSFKTSMRLQPQSIPTITVTSPNSTQNSATSRQKNTVSSVPLLHAAEIAIELPDTQDTGNASQPSSAPVPRIAPSSDTQDTFASTQNSEVFSPPDAFVDFTPPTQEGSQDAIISQVEPINSSNFATSEQTGKENPKTSRRSPHLPVQPLPSQVPPSAPSLGKRSRKTPADGNAAFPHKRTKSA